MSDITLNARRSAANLAKTPAVIPTDLDPFSARRSAANLARTPAVFPTDLDPIDDILGGGHAASAVHGLLSFTGVGRSNLGIMLAAAGAHRQWHSRERGGDAAPWVFATASEKPARLWAAALAFVAGISKSVVDSCGFSVAGSKLVAINTSAIHATRASEQQEENGSAVDGKKLHAALPTINTTLQILSLEGASYREGFGPVEQLLQQLAPVGQHDVSPVAGIVIDDVNLLVDKFRFGCGLTERTASALYAGFVQLCKSRLAINLACPVWLLHTLAGNRTKCPFHKLNHCDAADSRHFGDNLDACIVLGERDSSGAFPAKCTKSPCQPRRLSPRKLILTDSPWNVKDITPALEAARSLVDMTPSTRVYLSQLPDAIASDVPRQTKRRMRKKHTRRPEI